MRNRAVLTRRKPEILTVSRSKALTGAVVDKFFSMWEDLVREHSFQENPSRVFNCDETGLTTNPVHDKVYVRKGSKDAYMKAPNSGKTMFSVLFCVSATGVYLPPFTVYKSKNLYDAWTKGGPQYAGYGCSESGWMQDFNFEAWIITIFIPFVSDYEKPVLLTLDGHNSHLTYNTVKEAMANNIIILCLPPNTSHALQPLDVGVFKSVKASWRTILSDWFRDSRLQNVDKVVFPKLLAKLWMNLKPEHAANGFRGCGLLPVNRSAVQHRVIADASDVTDKEVVTPRSALRLAIIATVSPDTDQQVPSKARRRVQHEIGEILTEEAVLSRFEEEAKIREDKKKNKPAKKTAKKTAGKNKKKSASIDEMFIDSLVGGEQVEDTVPELISTEDEDVMEGGSHDVVNGVLAAEHIDDGVDVKMLREGVSYVLASYEGSHFPGLVTKLKKSAVEVSCMSKSGLLAWKWPAQPDIHAYPPQDIKAIINPPRAINKRNSFSVPEADNYWM